MLSQFPGRLRTPMTSNIVSIRHLRAYRVRIFIAPMGGCFINTASSLPYRRQAFPLIAPSTSTARLTISGNRSTSCLPEAVSSFLYPNASCMSVSSSRAPMALVRLTVQFRSGLDRFYVLIRCTLADHWRTMGTLYVLG